MLSVRAATTHDAVAIAHVHVQSWKTSYKGIVPQAYLDTLDETDRVLLWREWLTWDVQVLIADLDGEIVGFASGGSIHEPLQDYDAELFAIYLLEHAQGHGIGTALLNSLVIQLKAKDFKSMAVWVLENNTSRGFYEKAGALPIASKEIEIGGVMLPVVAYGWSDLNAIGPGVTPE